MDEVTPLERLIHDRRGKLLAMKIAIAIHDEVAYQTLLGEYQTLARQLRQLRALPEKQPTAA